MYVKSHRYEMRVKLESLYHVTGKKKQNAFSGLLNGREKLKFFRFVDALMSTNVSERVYRAGAKLLQVLAKL